jgi:hypothetical protein
MGSMDGAVVQGSIWVILLILIGRMGWRWECMLVVMSVLWRLVMAVRVLSIVISISMSISAMVLVSSHVSVVPWIILMAIV